MRLRLLLLTLAIGVSFTSSVARASTPVHLWSREFGANGTDDTYGVAIDATGNVVCTGTFLGSADLGGGSLTSAGNTDVFLAKYDANGAHLWSKRFGDTFIDRGYSVAADASGNIVISGVYVGTIDFGGGPLVYNGGNDEIFVAKFDPNGTHLWSKHFGSNAFSDNGYGVTFDASGDVVMTGTFGGTVDFGGGPFVSAGSNDVFIVKLDPNGSHIWSKHFGGAGNDRCNACAVDAAGNVTITGVFVGTTDFGGGPLTSAGGGDIFIAHYDNAGTHQWSKRAGNTGIDDIGESIAVDGSGNVVVVGTFQGSVDLGGGPLTNAGGQDMFIVRYDSAGSHQWSNAFGGSGNDVARDVAIDPSGNIVISIYFAGTADFGGGPMTSVGSSDLVIASFDAGGTYRYSQHFGTAGFEDGSSVAVDGAGHVAIGGAAGGAINFGGGALPYGGGTQDAYVAEFEDESAVPVLISSFKATPRGGAAIVEWDLHSDEGLGAFTLYRSENGASLIALAGGMADNVRTFTDTTVQPGRTYRYELVVATLGGNVFRSPGATVTMPALSNVLLQNEPNPFKARTTIPFHLAAELDTRLEVFDVSGRRVALLLDGIKRAGEHRVDFDASKLSSGVYFYRLTTGDKVEQKKMLLVK